MSAPESKPVKYPEYDENGRPNPIRVPISEDSESWEIEATLDNNLDDPNDPNSAVYRGHNW